MITTRKLLTAGVALTALACLTACAVKVENVQPARELAQAAKPPGSVYADWRVFQDKCARCHGPAGTGTFSGPDLLPRVREMGPRRFVGLVLYRYDWTMTSGTESDPSTAREALIDGVLQRKQGAIAMPAWQGEPRVQAHIKKLLQAKTA